MAKQPGKATYVDRKITQARLALGFERLWAALYWPLLVIAAAAALVLAGVLPLLPVWLRAGMLAIIAGAFLWSLLPLLRTLRGGWPDRAAAIVP